jgi:hypothetical protein
VRKVSVVLSVADDRVIPERTISEICDLFREFEDVRLEFVVVREAPSGFGMLSSDSDFVVLFDAVGHFSPLDVRKVVAPLLAGEADVVLGRNVSGVERAEGISFVAWLLNRFFRRSAIESKVGVQAFRRRALEAPASVLRFVEVDVSYHLEACPL